MSRFYRAIICARLVFSAYLFGKYKHSGYDGEEEYNLYEHKGRLIHIPKAYKISEANR